jgi:predicted alpha/beta-fold hydrolase
MTIAGNFMPRRNLLSPSDDRIITVDASNNSRVLCRCHWQTDRKNALTVIIVHGLEGSSESRYVIGTGSQCWQRGMNVVRMNLRTCGGTEQLTPTLYHNGMWMDILNVLHSLAASDGLQRFAVVGYSMGGNMVLKLAGELGNSAPAELKAVAAVSPATDLAISAAALHEPQNIIYEWKFLHGLVERFRRKAILHPELYDMKLVRGNGSIVQFDHRITARYGGFTGADDYYAKCSSGTVADRIVVPTLVIHALNDPFIIMSPSTRAAITNNQNICFLENSHGGHCAFLAETATGQNGFWAESTLASYFDQFTS